MCKSLLLVTMVTGQYDRASLSDLMSGVLFVFVFLKIWDHSQKPVLRKKTRKTLTCAAVLCEHSF